MAVTFTDKAGGELRARLARARRHARARRDVPLRGAAAAPPLRAGRVGRILPSKALLAPPDRQPLPGAYKFRPAGDLATEIEWAKNRRIAPEPLPRRGRRPRAADPADLMARVYRDYERRKAAQGLIDFEDLLERAVRAVRATTSARRATFRAQYRAFTVDEYQDVNLLQQTLLELWLGDRDDLCVVGDDYQSIYAFTGAGPEHLLGVPGALPARDRRAARGELPLDAAGARAREPARAAGSAARRRRCARRAPAGRSRSCARSRRRATRRAAIVERDPRARTCRSRRSRSSAARTRA